LPRFIKDDYLQQNSFSKYDKYCPFYKSVEMMRNICTFHRLATAAVEKTASGNAEGQKITLNVIKQRMSDVLYKITSQKFEDPGGCVAGVPGHLVSSLVTCRHSLSHMAATIAGVGDGAGGAADTGKALHAAEGEGHEVCLLALLPAVRLP
jgi:vacuolar-type H+-ATPase catalytic subunit A/Vma1